MSDKITMRVVGDGGDLENTLNQAQSSAESMAAAGTAAMGELSGAAEAAADAFGSIDVSAGSSIGAIEEVGSAGQSAGSEAAAGIAEIESAAEGAASAVSDAAGSAEGDLSSIGDEGAEAGDEVAGGASEAEAALQELIRRLGEAAASLDNASSSGEGFSNTLGGNGLKGAIIGAGAALGAMGVKAAVSGFKSLIGVGKESIALFAAQEAAEQRLETVIRQTGEAAGFTADQLKSYAGYLQTVTNVGDEVTMGAQAMLATFKNVRGEEFLRATELSLDLAEVFDMDLTNAAKQLGKALNDPIKGMTALGRAGVTFTEEQQEVIRSMVEAGDVAGAQSYILDELAGQVGGAAADKLGTFSGQMDSLKNRIGDVGEAIGGVLVNAMASLLPYMDAGVSILELLVGWLGDSAGTTTSFSDALEKSERQTDSWGKTILHYFTAAQTAIQQWQLTFEMAGTSVMLSLVRMGNEIEHVIGTVIPALLDWLVENWRDIFKTMGDYVVTVCQNMDENITKFFKNVMAWLKGEQGDWEFVALTEGFESSIKALPQIAAREMGAMEQALQEDLNRQADRMASAFGENLRANQARLDELRTGAGERPDMESTAEPIDPNMFRKPGDEEVDGKEGDGKEGGSGAAGGSGVAANEDLVSLHDRIQNAAAARREEAMKRLDEERNDVLGGILEAVQDDGPMAVELPEREDTDNRTTQADPALRKLDEINNTMGRFVKIADRVEKALPLRGTLA